MADSAPLSMVSGPLWLQSPFYCQFLFAFVTWCCIGVNFSTWSCQCRHNPDERGWPRCPSARQSPSRAGGSWRRDHFVIMRRMVRMVRSVILWHNISGDEENDAYNCNIRLIVSRRVVRVPRVLGGNLSWRRRRGQLACSTHSSQSSTQHRWNWASPENWDHLDWQGHK